MYRSIPILNMYTFRTIETDGRETNIYLGDHYTLTKLGHVNIEEFDHKLDVFFGDDVNSDNLKERDSVAAFIDAENLPNSLPLYYTKQHYIVTLSGKTFQKLNFVLPNERFSDTYRSKAASKIDEIKHSKIPLGDDFFKPTQNDTKPNGDKEMSIEELTIAGIIPNVEMIKTSSIEYNGQVLWVSEWHMDLEELLEKYPDYKIWIREFNPGLVRAIVHKPLFVKTR